VRRFIGWREVIAVVQPDEAVPGIGGIGRQPIKNMPNHGNEEGPQPIEFHICILDLAGASQRLRLGTRLFAAHPRVLGCLNLTWAINNHGGTGLAGRRAPDWARLSSERCATAGAHSVMLRVDRRPGHSVVEDLVRLEDDLRQFTMLANPRARTETCGSYTGVLRTMGAK